MGNYKEQIGFNLLSTITEGDKGQPSDQAKGAEDLRLVVKEGFLEGVGLGVSWDWGKGVG